VRPKIHEIYFGDWALPGHAGEAYNYPTDPVAGIDILFLNILCCAEDKNKAGKHLDQLN